MKTNGGLVLLVGWVVAVAAMGALWYAMAMMPVKEKEAEQAQHVQRCPEEEAAAKAASAARCAGVGKSQVKQ